MAIEMSGGVYCPLSPRDPQHRLHTLVQQTRSRFILTHHVTKSKFHDDVALVDMDLLLVNTENNADINRLSNVCVTADDIAYILFTSGSTGTPKAVGNMPIYIAHLSCCFHRLSFGIEI